jgi:hypothetical protein
MPRDWRHREPARKVEWLLGSSRDRTAEILS